MQEPKSSDDALMVLDTSDVDQWVGKPLGGGRMKDPVEANDIRRWAQGMQNPNPLYFDEAYAAQGRYERLVAPSPSRSAWTPATERVPPSRARCPAST